MFLSSHQLGRGRADLHPRRDDGNGRLVAQDRVAALLAPTGRVRLTRRTATWPWQLLLPVRGRPAGRAASDGDAAARFQLDGLAPEQLNHDLVRRPECRGSASW